MVRWQPDTRARLQAAALELFVDRGYDETTAADIAEAAGVTERTFFRHFADKREVLFDGQQFFSKTFVDGVEAARPDDPPLTVVASALDGAAAFFPDERREWSRGRQAIIDAHPALQERELLKLSGLAIEVAAALRSHGVDEPAATLAAQSCLTVFGVSFATWITDGETRPFAEISRDTLAQLRTLTG
ncbi:TetR family transcriptional regulator [Frigoribacterium sp. VKM Ac-1396]|uniref:TetR/AcrR family transcriptional regulator n=1 Tax=Frigoribacterium sp. VKM Ac-1396 TaxID=2783821 RepID=UPI001889EE33|nr:TetR/AcrR family transcriptional regulator [Frigoribacterium sp. VKM Ac-1396]MBF4602261.1 TetR family transcriptional regulator [Frigoribacterium sp. VKM Ac-1396]